MQANNIVFSTKLDFNNLVYFLWTHLQDRPRASLPDCLCPCTAPRILAGAAVTALTGFLLTAAFLLAFRFLISPFRVLSCSNTNRPTGFHTPNCPRSGSNWPFLPTPLLCFPPPLPSSFPRPAGLSKWEEGSRRYARSWQAERFPLGGNVAFFTFNPERNMVLRKLVFSTESSQRKKREQEGPAAPHSGLTTHPCPIRRLILGGNCPGQSAELQRLSWHTVRDSHSHV